MRNLKRDRCIADLVLTASESKFALNGWPLQCCHYSQHPDEASLQQQGWPARKTVSGVKSISGNNSSIVNKQRARSEPSNSRTNLIRNSGTWT
jgi:hypothetical protein